MRVDSATDMSAWGRTVKVGGCEGEGDVGLGVIEERKSGHSVMARERVLRRK